MRVRKKIDFLRVLLYILFGVAAFCLFCIGNNAEPFSIALLYGMLASGLSPLPSLTLCALPALLGGSIRIIVVYAVQAVLVALGFLLQSKLYRAPFGKIGVFTALTLCFALLLFVGFAPFQPYALPLAVGIITESLPQKIIITASLFLLSAVFTVALRALLKKFLKCRLRSDELIFTVFFLLLVGVGVCRFFGVNAYMGISVFVILLFACATKDASALFCAFLLALPPMLVARLSPEKFFFYGSAVVLFIKHGRLAAACAVLLVFFGYGYFEGIYDYTTLRLSQALLSVLLPSLFFVILPNPLIRAMENRFIFYREKHLSRVAINRNRAAIGEKLFELSAVFREIQTAFTSLGSKEAEQGAKDYLRSCVIESTCKKCPHFEECLKKGLDGALSRLIEVGCLKGKTTLIDIPRALSNLCVNQSNILYAVNRQLTEYRKYTLEMENAANGRAMLASQAQGVSEILKNLALEQSEPLRIYSDKERALNIALLSAGIVCSELLIYGDENNPTLSLVTFGRADVKKIAAIASHLFGAPMMISERLTLSQDKFCCILRKKPCFDAAFGVATRTKTGERVSGDTHSVIKIDERKFLVALSDGMGSGEYAQRISESTLSLLESFYRAKMNSELVLSTINKLLTFNKEESFACVDIAVVDLDSGSADIVKIGSPCGFILSGNTVKVLESNSLPLGILDNLHPDGASYDLLENDVLLFLSDGIADAFGSATDLYDVLRSIPVNNPQQLADALLDEALRAYGGVAKDDMTAIAVRLFKTQPIAA